MQITIEIKQKAIFKKNFDLKGFIKKHNLFYGSYNAYFVLRENMIDKQTIVFDRKAIGRGIEITSENKNVTFKLSLPATKEDISLLYDLVKSVCKDFNLSYFFKKDNKVELSEISQCIKEDEESSTKILDEMEKKIYLTRDENIVLFSALHPITFGEKEIDEVEGSLDKFGALLHKLQNQRLYYAAPTVYQKKNGQMIVAFHVDEEMLTVLPVEPVIYGPNKVELRDWYIFFAGGSVLRLETFYEHVPHKQYYDSNHYSVCLSEEEISNLIENYNIDLNTDKHIKGFYFGTIIDSAELYKQDKVNDSLAAYSHIAIYLKYAHEHSLLSDKFYEAIPKFVDAIKSGDDLRNFIKTNRYIVGEVRIGFFNQRGRDFTLAYYNIDGEGYLNDLKIYTNRSKQGKSFLDLPYNDENKAFAERLIHRAENIFFETEE